VDRQEAAVAVIIPPDFTTAVVEPEGEASVELYYDPTLQIGPGIVEDVVSQFVEGLAGSRLAAEVAGRQLSEYGSPPQPQRLREISMAYGDWSSALGEGQPEGTSPLIDVRTPREAETENLLTVLLRPIAGGMMIFYAFFTGASASQSILDEEEAGTLSRLFTTPTPLSRILGGKLLAVFATIFVQVVVLMTLAALVFHVGWGETLPLVLVTLGLVVLASSFGIFLTSLLNDTGQAGLVFGGVMTITGMVGINAMFTANVPGGSSVSTIADTVALLVPQGWAMRGWRTVMEGGGVNDVLPTVAVMLMLGGAFFIVGTLRFRKRFA